MTVCLICERRFISKKYNLAAKCRECIQKEIQEKRDKNEKRLR